VGVVKEFVEFVVRALVDSPDAVEINQVEGERTSVIEVKVASEDLGKIIGKQGRIANALRTIVKAAAMKDNKKVTLEILP
jgi:predicted RNA-binding protein YlqC (UPF0109 family)